MSFLKDLVSRICILPLAIRSGAALLLALGTLPLRSTAQDLATPPGKIQGTSGDGTAERIVVNGSADLDAYTVPDPVWELPAV